MTTCYCTGRGDDYHDGGSPGCIAGTDDKLTQARREAMDWLHGTGRAAGLDGRFAGPLGLVRALITESGRRCEQAWEEGFTKAGRLLTGMDNEPWPPTPNPYRPASEQQEDES